MRFTQTNGCPECQSMNITYSVALVEGTNAVQEAICLECDHEWHDVYAYSYSEHIKEVKASADI